MYTYIYSIIALHTNTIMGVCCVDEADANINAVHPSKFRM